jgi:pimeloyl-ACP methyl ester carboxylesterase
MGRVSELSEHTEQLDGQPVFWRSAPVADGGPPPLYVHGVPANSDVWAPFLERTGGIAVDLPGFGRSGKRGDLDYSIAGYARFLRSFLELVEVDDVRLVMEDWGACALGWAQDEPERVRRLVLIDAVPLMAGYRWHRVARAWRMPFVGEMAMGLSIKPVLRRSIPPALVDTVAAHFDQGTQRAILRLYRWADPERLAEAGARLGDLQAPALVVWGEDDPYIPVRFAHGYAAMLGGEVELDIRPGAGHWPWTTDPAVVDRVADFLAQE